MLLEPPVMGGEVEYLLFPFEPSGSTGDYRTRTVAGSGSWRVSFQVPPDFKSLVSLVVGCIVSAGAAGSGKNIDLDSDYGAAGESSTAHSESDATSTYNFTGLSGMHTDINVAGVFSQLAADDRCGLLITHNAIGGALDYLFLRLGYRR